MNCIFRSLFNTRLGVFQAVSENTRTRSKQSGSKTNRHSKGAVLLGSLGLLLSPLALADLPSGANIVHGNASITSSGQAMQINQSSHQLITDWQRFNIGAGHSVTFNQPSAASVALNRVVGSDASTILGNLNANGQVFLVNPNGILFGQGAQVNVGGLVASTLDIRNEDFLNGNYQFQSDTTPAGILNQGSITAADGGVVALLGGRVSNEGVIQARLGSVALAAGQAITLDFAGDGLLSVQIDQATLDALVENHQLIQADGGQVLLTASAADALLQTVVNNTGVIQARTLEERAGQIVLLGDFAGGTVEVAGTLDASVPESGNGGFIDTSGHRVRIDDSVEITTRATEGETGTWLIDPDGFTIGQGGDITGATLSSQLLDNNVELESVQGTGGDGHIHVNDAVSWSQNTLTLSATNNIYVNNVMTATGSASFVANYGSGTDADGVPYGLYTAQGERGEFAGKINFDASGSVVLNGETYTVIHDLSLFRGSWFNLIDANVRIAFGSDINPDATISSNLQNHEFNGLVNGLGHTVTNGFKGHLFGALSETAAISNLGIKGDIVNPASATRNLFVRSNEGRIVNNFAVGSIIAGSDGFDYLGGLVGENQRGGLIANSYVDIDISGGRDVGGLVARNLGLIVNSRAYGVVRYLESDYYSLAYTAGGLVGVNQQYGSGVGVIRNSYADVTVDGRGVPANAQSAEVGGLVGRNEGNDEYQALIEDSYAVGEVIGEDGIGSAAGFVVNNSGIIRNAYTASPVSGGATAAGFVINNTGTIENAYWDSSRTGQANDAYATVLSGDAARQLSNYAGFDDEVWGSSAEGHPILKRLPVYIATTDPLVYGSAADPFSGLTVHGAQWGDGIDRFTLAVGAAHLSPTGHLNAGAHSASAVLASDNYLNRYGFVTVSPRELTQIGTVIADKVYDGNTDAEVLFEGTLDGFIPGEQVTSTLHGAFFVDKQADYGKAVSLDYAFYYGGERTYNYVVANQASADITPRELSVAEVAVADKVYDGNTSATASLNGLQGVVDDDQVSIGTVLAAFADDNAGNNKAVSINASLAGEDAGNYTLVVSGTGNILPKAVYLVGAKAQDGSTSIAGDALQVANLVSGDSVSVSGNAALNSSISGVQELSLDGLVLDNPNYTLVGGQGSVVVYDEGANSIGLLGPIVTQGSIDSITTEGNTTTITQNSDTAAIDWYRFSIGAGQTVRFIQPDAGSILLNRVIGNERSVIEGSLQANGRVFILNANGVLFAAGSSIDVAALVASTQNLANDYFIAGKLLFGSNAATGSVINEGDIVVVEGGFAALLGKAVSNTGSIQAPGGDILLVGGDGVELTLDGDGKLDGHVVTQLDQKVVVGGVLDVSSSTGDAGRIETAGSTFDFAESLQMELDAPNGAVGTWSITLPDNLVVGQDIAADLVETTLGKGNLTLNALTGDIGVADGFGWSRNTLRLNTVRDILVGDVMTVSGTGNFHASYGSAERFDSSYGGLDWLTDAVFDLRLYGVNMAYAKDADGNNLNRFAGRIDFDSSGEVRMGVLGDLKTYQVIRSAEELDAIRNNTELRYENIGSDANGTLARDKLNQRSSYCGSGADCTSLIINTNYVLGRDVDLSGFADWTPIGSDAASMAPMTGLFNGFGHTIANLQSTQGGLFDTIYGMPASIRVKPDNTANWQVRQHGLFSNLGIVDAELNITDGRYEDIGVLARWVTQAALKNVFVTGSIHAEQPAALDRNGGAVGGVAGRVSSTHVDNSYADVDLVTKGYSRVGGFAGSLYGDVQNSYAIGNVDASKLSMGTILQAGGFAGMLHLSNIKNSYATGNVKGVDYVGGFAGSIIDGRIYNSYASGSVTMDDSMLNYNQFGDVYAEVARNGDGFTGAGAGGFAGMSIGFIANSHAEGRVEATSGRTELLGGFVGYTMSEFGGLSVNNYWNAETSGLTHDGRGNIVPEQGGHHAHITGNSSGTPIADALGLTPEQLHGGAHALTAAEFEYVGELTNGTRTLAEVREALQVVARVEAAKAVVDQVMTQPLPLTMAAVAVDPTVDMNLLNALAVSGDQDTVDDSFSISIQQIEVDGVSYELEADETSDGVVEGASECEDEFCEE